VADRLIERPTRRLVLTSGVLLLATVATGAVFGLRAPFGPPPRTALRVLSSRSFRVLAAVAARVCPGGPGLPTAWEIGVPEKVDAVLARLHPAHGTDVHRALLLLDNAVAGFLLDGRPAWFTRADGDAQDRILESWHTSGIGVRRSAYRAIAGLVSAAYWSDPRTFAHSGYRPVPP
jgi:hypothetical protein